MGSIRILESAFPTDVPLIVSQGSDTQIECALTDPYGDPVDITLDSVTFTAWDYIGGTQKFQKTSAAGAHEDSESGIVQFTLSRSDFPVSSDVLDWTYEVRRIQPGGVETVHISGELSASPSGA